MKLMLKGDRCFSDKCAFDRRSYAPGQHGQKRGKLSDYGVQLREKQKVRRTYGLTEKQFHLLFKRATRMKGITGTHLLALLERRLDNVVYRIGFANSRNQSRQIVQHNHILVNSKKVNIPSYIVQIGDIIEVKQRSQKIAIISDSLDTVVRRGIPQWIELEKESFKGIIKAIPIRDDITTPMQEQLIVELYSK
jgi:small subunit ribosomal protein S4